MLRIRLYDQISLIFAVQYKTMYYVTHSTYFCEVVIKVYN